MASSLSREPDGGRTLGHARRVFTIEPERSGEWIEGASRLYQAFQKDSEREQMDTSWRVADPEKGPQRKGALSYLSLAEREGFEPPYESPHNLISSSIPPGILRHHKISNRKKTS